MARERRRWYAVSLLSVCILGGLLSVGMLLRDDWIRLYRYLVVRVAPLELKEKALREILRASGNDIAHSNLALETIRVTEVVCCPQESGLPLLLVFFDLESVSPVAMDSGAGRFFKLLDHKGQIVRPFLGRDVLTGACIDANADDVIDIVDDAVVRTTEGRLCRVLYVVPVTVKQEPTLLLVSDGLLTSERLFFEISLNPQGEQVELFVRGESIETHTRRDHGKFIWVENLKDYVGPVNVQGVYRRVRSVADL